MSLKIENIADLIDASRWWPGRTNFANIARGVFSLPLVSEISIVRKFNTLFCL